MEVMYNNQIENQDNGKVDGITLETVEYVSFGQMIHKSCSYIQEIKRGIKLALS